MPGSLRTPAILSSVVVLPFVVLELVNRLRFHEDFPFPLFGLMWLLALSFVIILMSIPRNQHTHDGSIANPLSVLPRVVLLILIAWLWIGIILDQMPCFLGVPNCD